MDLLRWMQQWDMVPEKGEVVLCAVSGGRDSMCLLHYLHSIAPACGFTVAAGHFNHQMRADADADPHAHPGADPDAHSLSDPHAFPVAYPRAHARGI